MNDSLQENYSRYKLAVAELYHPYFHGDDNNWNDDFRHLLFTSFLHCFSIEKNEMFDDDIYMNCLRLRFSRNWPDIEHPYIRNYMNVTRPFRVDIVEMIELETGHMICIPKTFWLKIFQRKFKNYNNKLQKRIQRAKNPKILIRRSTYGCTL
jgi:hypothetical protein